MSNVSKKYNVIGIAVSGQDKNSLQVSHFISVLGSKNIEIFNIQKLLNLNELNIQYTNKSTQINYTNLINYADKLNTIFHEKFKIAVHKRPFFFAALLFSFDKITNFLNNYITEQLEIKNEKTGRLEKVSFNDSQVTESDKIDFINGLVSDGVADKFSGKLNNRFKVIQVPSKFNFITTDNKNISSQDYIKFLK